MKTIIAKSIQISTQIILFTLELILVINFILVLIFIITGGFTYEHIGLGKTSLEVHNIWRAGGIFLILLSIIEFFKKIWGLKTRRFALHNPLYYLISLFFLYNAFVIPFCLNRYYSFNLTFPEDLAHRSQAIYNTLNGHPLLTTTYGYALKNWNLLVDHFSPIYLLFVPIYFFITEPTGLFVIQILLISSGGIILYLISINRLRNRWAALGISLSYLLYPMVTKFYFFEVREDYFALFFLLLAFLCLERKLIKTMIISLFFALLCKENVSISVFLIGLYIIFFKKDIINHKKLGLLISIFSFIYGICINKLILPYLHHHLISGGFDAYDEYASNLNEFIKGFIRNPPFSHITSISRFYLASIRQLAYMPLFSPLILFSIGVIAENIMGSFYFGGARYAFEWIWHSTLFIPFLFISYIYGIENLLKIKLKYIRLLSQGVIFWGCVVGIPLFIGLLDFHNKIITPFVETGLYLSYKPKEFRSFVIAKQHLPHEGGLLTTYNLLPNVSDRKLLYDSTFLRDINYIDCLLYYTKPYFYQDMDKELFKELLSSGKFEIFYEYDGFLIAVNKKMITKKTCITFDFSDRNFLSTLKFNPSNVKYRCLRSIGGLILSIFFDGDSNEDEYVQIKFGESGTIDVTQYPMMELSYKLDYSQIQLIELVLGIDLNSDGKVDNYVSRIYKENTKSGTFDKYRLNIYEFLKDKFPDRTDFKILQIEIYPHKWWGYNCPKGMEWYFWIKSLEFYNTYLKEGD